jgi:hypothetical protein
MLSILINIAAITFGIIGAPRKHKTAKSVLSDGWAQAREVLICFDVHSYMAE